jgi:hypothetical protein
MTMILRVVAALLLAMLSAPAGARAPPHDVDVICAGTLVHSPSGNPDFYEIDWCSFGPGNVSTTILAWCHVGDTCIVRAIVEEPEDNIKRVISVDKLCTAADGTKTFLCPRPLGR